MSRNLSDRYSIRSPRVEDLPVLQQIEQNAAKLFAQTPYAFIADGESLPIEVLQTHLDRGTMWVAVTDRDLPVGFAIASVVDGTAYLQEIDVDPAYGKQGIGRKLVETVCLWTKEHNYSITSLSTFIDIPWNAPFYAKLGFEIVDESKLTPGFQAIRQKEADAGLAIAHRAIMFKT
jgi:GNAT superfamily N-acetyltransferase